MIPTNKSGEFHSEAEWEQVKDTFLLLYNIQQKPLPEVRKFLADKLGFYATPRQYKTRILKWGAQKYSTRSQHHDEPKRAVRRNIIVPTRQPPQPHLIRSLHPPGHLATIHVASFGMSSFYSGVLQGEIDRSEVREQNPEWNIRQFFNTANSVSILAAESKWQKAQVLYSQLLDYAVPILHDRNPIILVCLLQVCARFYQDGQGAVLRRFLGFLAAVSSAKGMESHPMRLLATAWIQSGEHSLDLINLCSEQALDIMTKQLGSEHPQTLSAWRALYSARYARKDFASALDAITSATEVEAKLNLGDLTAIDARFRKTLCLLSMNDLEASAANFRLLDAEFARFAADNPADSAHIRRLKQSIQTARGELLRRQLDPRAEEVLAEVVETLASISETHNSWMLVYAEKQLACARASLKEGRVEPFVFPC